MDSSAILVKVSIANELFQQKMENRPELNKKAEIGKLHLPLLHLSPLCSGKETKSDSCLHYPNTYNQVVKVIIVGIIHTDYPYKSLKNQ